MEAKYKTHLILGVILLLLSPSFLPETYLWANEDSKYLDVVREFADNVLKYGRDTYGPKHTPLFVDGLNIHTHEPVKWIAPNGDRWILSNLASQQNLFRVLDGLTTITGDPKYRQAAMDAIKYAFENLRTPSGLFYWGHITAYDALGDTVRGNKSRQSWKLHYPYYDLMWKVDPDATKKLIEALWSAHILDWSNLDFCRHGSLKARLEEPWNHEYEGEPTFFKSKSPGAVANYLTGSSLIQAGTTLYKLSGQEQPFVWSKRLAKRFVDTRHPKTGISALIYNHSWLQLGEDMKEHFVDPYTTIFPWDLYEWRRLYYPENAQAHPWMSILLAGKLLGEEGKELTQWALEELRAWGRASYRKKDNCFVPMLTDGTNLEGYVWEKGPGHSSGLNVIKPYFADPSFFWAYSVAYRITGDKFMWQMVRDIALGNNFGDIGQTPADNPNLQTNTTCSHAYGVFGFLELYKKTKKPAYLEISRRIGDNILTDQFNKGFIVPSKSHIYTRFDCFEPMALLHLIATIEYELGSVPQAWPSCPLFVPAYRHKFQGIDRRDIYTLTEASEPPMSLQEAAAIGDITLVRTLLDSGTDVESVDEDYLKTALHRAAMSGHKDVAKLLLANGADVNAIDWFCGTPLHYAIQRGHTEIGEMLITNGADLNAKNNEGQTPVDIAVGRNRSEVVQLLIEKGADVSSIHLAAYLGDAAKVMRFIEKGSDVNARNQEEDTPLHYVAMAGSKEVSELLLSRGADINVKGKHGATPLHWGSSEGHRDLAELLITKGAEIDARDDTWNETPLHWSAYRGHEAVVELLISKGANIHVKDKDGYTPLHWTVHAGHRDVTELLISKGADVNAKGNKGETALSLTKKKGHTKIVELLRKRGAKEDKAPESAPEEE